MNSKEMIELQPTNEVVARMLKERNKGTSDCVTTSFVACQFGMTGMELNNYLVDMNILKRKRKEKKLELVSKYQNQGLCKYRSRFGYNSMGQIFEIVYPVWTKKGVDFLANKLGTNLRFK